MKAGGYCLPLEAGDKRHGSIGAYTNHRCRCEVCRKSWRLFMAEKRAARVARLATEPVAHGLYSTYTNWGCRCDRCRRANTRYAREYKYARSA